MKVKIQKLKRLQVELWKAVDAHNGVVEAQSGEVESL
jgi:hypothetical protein